MQHVNHYGAYDGRVFTSEISMDWSGDEFDFTPLDCNLDEATQEFTFYLCKGYDIDWTMVMALMQKESSFRSDIISCVYGQILLLDLIEHIEPYAQLIQSNTDGILIKMPDGQDEDEWFNKIDDIAYEWEQRTGLTLEFDEYRKVFQKDVNNYIIVAPDGHIKSKGAYVKKLSNLDYGDFPIVNHALVEYMTKGVPVENFINRCDDLKEFQMVTKITNKYSTILHGDEPIKEKCIRVFASTKETDAGVKKVSIRTGKPEKIASSPEHCFIFNEDMADVRCPSYLDKQWYVDMANKRLEDFGVM